MSDTQYWEQEDEEELDSLFNSIFSMMESNQIGAQAQVNETSDSHEEFDPLLPQDMVNTDNSHLPPSSSNSGEDGKSSTIQAELEELKEEYELVKRENCIDEMFEKMFFECCDVAGPPPIYVYYIAPIYRSKKDWRIERYFISEVARIRGFKLQKSGLVKIYMKKSEEPVNVVVTTSSGEASTSQEMKPLVDNLAAILDRASMEPYIHERERRNRETPPASPTPSEASTTSLPLNEPAPPPPPSPAPIPIPHEPSFLTGEFLTDLTELYADENLPAPSPAFSTSDDDTSSSSSSSDLSCSLLENEPPHQRRAVRDCSQCFMCQYLTLGHYIIKDLKKLLKEYEMVKKTNTIDEEFEKMFLECCKWNGEGPIFMPYIEEIYSSMEEYNIEYHFMSEVARIRGFRLVMRDGIRVYKETVNYMRHLYTRNPMERLEFLLENRDCLDGNPIGELYFICGNIDTILAAYSFKIFCFEDRRPAFKLPKECTWYLIFYTSFHPIPRRDLFFNVWMLFDDNLLWLRTTEYFTWKNEKAGSRANVTDIDKQNYGVLVHLPPPKDRNCKASQTINIGFMFESGGAVLDNTFVVDSMTDLLPIGLEGFPLIVHGTIITYMPFHDIFTEKGYVEEEFINNFHKILFRDGWNVDSKGPKIPKGKFKSHDVLSKYVKYNPKDMLALYTKLCRSLPLRRLGYRDPEDDFVFDRIFKYNGNFLFTVNDAIDSTLNRATEIFRMLWLHDIHRYVNIGKTAPFEEGRCQDVKRSLEVWDCVNTFSSNAKIPKLLLDEDVIDFFPRKGAFNRLCLQNLRDLSKKRTYADRYKVDGVEIDKNVPFDNFSLILPPESKRIRVM